MQSKDYDMPRPNPAVLEQLAAMAAPTPSNIRRLYREVGSVAYVARIYRLAETDVQAICGVTS